jgi:phosphate transport system substrate-binding protein
MKRMFAFAFLVAASCGCSSSGRLEPVVQAPAGGVALRGAGATFPYMLYRRWFAAYRDAHPDVAIAYDSVGSGEGVRRFMGLTVKDEERVDFGASDAAMTDEQIAQARARRRSVPATAEVLRWRTVCRISLRS